MTWALDPPSLRLLARRLDRLRPTLAVEAGSGKSTDVFARYAGHTISLEHHPTFAIETLQRFKRVTPVELRRCPIVPTETPGGIFPWYATTLPDGIEFALIDGPPGHAYGRQGAGFAILPHLADGGEVWLDDANREHEQACLALWGEHFDLTVEAVDGEGSLVSIRTSTV